MAQWLIFIKERFPILVYLSLSLGIAWSAFCLSGEISGLGTVFVAAFGIMFFFFTLRVMDEYKDYAKDLIAHPTRPLPRGLIAHSAIKKTINYLMITMVVFALFVGMVFNLSSLFLYAFTTGYLYCMFKEFYSGQKLSSYPLLYAFSHQIVLFPLIFFALSLFDAEFLTMEKILFTATVFCTFFTYEISRKLDPKAPAILGTYWVVCGRLRTTSALLILISLGMVANVELFHEFYFLPLSFLVLGTLLLFLIQQKFFKLVEITASISLLTHIWSVGLWRLLS